MIALWVAFALALVLSAMLAFRADALAWTIDLRGLRLAAQGVFVFMAVLAWRLAAGREPAAATHPDRGRHTHALLAVIALATAFGVYARTLGDYLYADDYQFWALTLRGHYSSLIALFTPGATYAPHGYFRPISILFYVVNHAMWGEWRTGLHVTTLGLHATATYLTALLAWRISGQPAVAIITALLYGAHPVRFEVATFVSNREVVLSALAYLGGLLFVLRYVAGGSVAWLLASLATFVAGLLAKELTLSLPLAVLVIAWWARPPARRRALTAAAGLATVVAAWLVFQWATRGMLATSGHHFKPRRTVEVLLSDAWWYVFYPLSDLALGPGMLRALIVVGLTVPLLVVARGIRRSGVFWILAMVSALPIASFFDPSVDLHHARHIYLVAAFASIGLAVAFANVRGEGTRWGRMASPAAAMLLATYLLTTMVTVEPWVALGRLAHDAPRAIRDLIGPYGPKRTTAPHIWVAAEPPILAVADATMHHAFALDMRRARGTTYFDPLGPDFSWTEGDMHVDPFVLAFHGGPWPDVRNSAREARAEFVVWQQSTGRVTDVTDAMKRRLADPPCAGQARLLDAGATTTGGAPKVAAAAPLMWMPSPCDHITGRMRIRPRPGPYEIPLRARLRWVGPDGEREGRWQDLGVPADGGWHVVDVAIGRHPGWLLADPVERVWLELGWYAGHVAWDDLRVMRRHD